MTSDLSAKCRELCRDLPDVAVVTARLEAPASIPGRHQYLKDRHDPLVYPVLFKLGQTFTPQRICSIGVLFGWSVASIMEGSASVGTETQSVFLVDSADYSSDSPQIARENISRCFPSVQCDEFLGDSASPECRAAVLAHQPFDFVEVDGDHTARGALSDLRLAWESLCPGGIMIVDDSSSEMVLTAITTFVRESGFTYIDIPSSHGIALWQKGI